MAFLTINPTYRDLLQRHDLASTERILALPGVIVSGHPDRHVVRCTLGDGRQAAKLYLKKEHRVRWKDRLLNWLAGFGLRSKSVREARLLQAVRREGIACPELVAAGENGSRAFLMVREIAGAVGLPDLARRWAGRHGDRRRLARRLGEKLAMLHDAGFDHPDLFAKHVLVDRAGRIHILDWQRSRGEREVAWPRRWRDLGALDATLSEEQATALERLVCLRAYLRTALGARPPEALVQRAVQRIRQRSGALQGRRAVREARQKTSKPPVQQLMWLDGEALCATPEFAQTPGLSLLKGILDEELTGHCHCARTWLAWDEDRRALLVRRRSSSLGGWLGSLLSGRRVTSPELQRAGLLYRLERFGISVPRVLAFGQKASFPWVLHSFLLTEDRRGTVPLLSWLGQGPPFWSAQRKQHWRCLRQAGDLLCRLHEAHCYFRPQAEVIAALAVEGRSGGPAVVLQSDRFLQCVRKPRPNLVLQDLCALHDACSGPELSRTDRLRFLLSYLRIDRLNPRARSLAREVLRTQRCQTRAWHESCEQLEIGAPDRRAA